MKRRLIFTLALVLVLLVSGVALATGGYDLSWHTVAGGGGTSAGGAYTLSGTIGQPDAGTLRAGSAYTLAGGFWPSLAQALHDLFLPLIRR